MNLSVRELVQTIGQRERPIEALSFESASVTDNQKRALVKRIADIYEKVGVAGLALGLFQYNFQGALIGLGFLTVSLLLTYLLER